MPRECNGVIASDRRTFDQVFQKRLLAGRDRDNLFEGVSIQLRGERRLWRSVLDFAIRSKVRLGECTELGTDYICVGGIPADEPGRVRNRLAIWYQRKTRKVIEARFEAAWSRLGAGRRPRLVVRPMEKRWGSLSASGHSMIVNRRLVEADLDAIDSVIVHELTHLAHHHHGPEFIALLSARIPDWREPKKRLERWMA